MAEEAPAAGAAELMGSGAMAGAVASAGLDTVPMVKNVPWVVHLRNISINRSKIFFFLPHFSV